MTLNIFDILNKPIKNRHLKYGLPFLCFIGVGWVLIRECATVRYEFRNCRSLHPEEVKSLGFIIKEKPETIEEAYEKYQKLDIDNWENKRGPRLWEE